MTSNRLRWLAKCLAFLIAGPALAMAADQSTDTLVADYQAYLDAHGGADGSLAQAEAATSLQRVLCSTCHGERGTSAKPELPNLAGQQPLYLIQQILKFQSEDRTSQTMHWISGPLSREMVFNLARFYSAQSPTTEGAPPEGDSPERRARGRAIFLKRCQPCHGPTAMGQGIYARLAGQKSVYLQTNLERFRSRAAARKNEGMRSITADLTDGDIKALVDYLTSL